MSEPDVNTKPPASRSTIAAKHSFESCFVALGEYSADKALIALTAAVHADSREMNTNAYDWIVQALPGATLKPALAIGTVRELYRVV